MNLPKPTLPPFDPHAWKAAPWETKVRLMTESWVVQGFGAPWSVYLFYLAKMMLFVGGWVFFTGFSEGVAGAPLSEWAWSDIAFQKAILWAWCFEQLGLGCGSGPLTGRYLPPVAAPFSWLRPGTVRLPWAKAVPGFSGSRRGLVDIVGYLLLVGSLVRALLAPELGMAEVLPPVVLLPLLTLRDKVQFLAARGEHYWVTAACFLWTPEQWIPAAMAVNLAIWLWAAVSKLTPHFPTVVSVMTSNSPLTSAKERKSLVRDFPSDLRPSKKAYRSAYFGAFLEFAFPLLLLAGEGGWVTLLGMVVMVLFHTYITSAVPMGVPLEWNVMVVYGAFWLWWRHAEVSPFDLSDPLLCGLVLLFTVAVPVVGHLAPRFVSFLLAMRYYAGNWPFTVWFFTPDALQTLDEKLKRVSPLPHKQVETLYGESVAIAVIGKVVGFRSMHLQGRVLHGLVRRFVPELDKRVVLDGELVAGVSLGWNFGDGHLSGPQLMAALQERCGFAEGDVRVICVESQPLHRWTLDWEAWDVSAGKLGTGRVSVKELMKLQPFPEPAPVAPGPVR